MSNTFDMNFEHPRIPLNDSVLASSGFADQNTPLVKNCWYVAALAHEVTRELFSRRFLGIEVALYRTEAGEPIAMRNRCPHRSFPLAKGALNGDNLRCGYHGMEFAPSGRCVNLPSMINVPTNAAVRTYDIVERGPLLWIWMGDPDLADPALIPETPWLESSEWKTVNDQFHMKSDYVSMHENLLDQTHFPFLHPGAIGTPEYARSKLEARVEDDKVIIERQLLNSPPPGVYAGPTKLGGIPVNRFSTAMFVSPAMHVAFARIVDITKHHGSEETYRFNISHIFTPETNGSIHYWWFCSRDFDLQNKETDKHLYESSQKAYTEDVDALEWILEVVNNDPEKQFDLNFAPDRPGLMMRRILHDLSLSESGLDPKQVIMMAR